MKVDVILADGKFLSSLETLYLTIEANQTMIIVEGV